MQRALGGADVRPDDYAIHPTEIIVRGVKQGKAFKALMSLDRLDELIARCNQQFRGDE